MAAVPSPRALFAQRAIRRAVMNPTRSPTRRAPSPVRVSNPSPFSNCWINPDGRRCCYQGGRVTCVPARPTTLTGIVPTQAAIAIPNYYAARVPVPGPHARMNPLQFTATIRPTRTLICPANEACFDVICLPVGEKWVCARTNAGLFSTAYKSA